MNPLTSYSTEGLEVQQLIYDKLMDYDAQLKAVPSLAESSEVSADGTEVTYHLRSGVTWHDGKPFTSEADPSEIGFFAEWDSHDQMMESSERSGEAFQADAGTQGLDWETRIWHRLI